MYNEIYSIFSGGKSRQYRYCCRHLNYLLVFISYIFSFSYIFIDEYLAVTQRISSKSRGILLLKLNLWCWLGCLFLGTPVY